MGEVFETAKAYRDIYTPIIRTAFWAGISIGLPLGSVSTLLVWIFFYSK